MKKLIGTLVAAMLAAAVFADIGIGGFGRGFFVPFAWDGAAKMGNIVGWGDGGPRVGISVGGSSDNIGFGIGIKADGGELAVNDDAYIWAKPCDWFKITVGQWFDDTLRGSCYFGTWDWVRSSVTKGDDLTFTRIFNTHTGTGIFADGSWDPMRGALLSLMPVDGLYIAAGLNIASLNGGRWDNTYAPYGTTAILDALKWGQYQVGYTVDSVVAVKAQYIGQNSGSNSTGIVNVAADILAVEGNKISIGVYIPTVFANTPLAVAATYNGSFDALSVGAYVAANLPTDTAKTVDILIGAGIGYDLGDGMSIDGDVRAEINATAAATGAVSLGVYFNKGFSNGGLGVGVEAGFGFGGGTAKFNNFNAKDVTVIIPVRLQYWF